jgi:uncharacterized protein YjdB
MKSLLFVATLVAVGACGATAGDAVTPTDFVSCLPGPTVRPPSATLHSGDTLRVTATVSSCSLPATFRWSSSDSNVAFVDSLSGLIRARSLGTATIIAALAAERSVKGAMLLVVAQ